MFGATALNDVGSGRRQNGESQLITTTTIVVKGAGCPRALNRYQRVMDWD